MNTTQLQAMTKMVGMESGASGDCDSQKGDLKLTRNVRIQAQGLHVGFRQLIEQVPKWGTLSF